MNHTDKHRICDLAGKLFDESIEDDEFDELEELLNQDPDCQEWYLHCMQQDALLQEKEVVAPDLVASQDSGYRFNWLALAAAFGILITGTVIGISFVSSSSAVAAHPTVEYLEDSVKLSYEDGTVAVLEQPARFQLNGNNRLTLKSGKLVARRGSSDSEFEIAMADHTFRPGAGEFGFSLGGESDPELHIFDGEGDLETGSGASRKKVVPGSVMRIASQGQLNPSLISEAAKFKTRHGVSSGGIVENFSRNTNDLSPGWSDTWITPGNGQTLWKITDSTPSLTRKSGAFLSVFRDPESIDSTHLIPWRGERRELEASHIRWSRQYEGTDTFSPEKSHSIEFLFRLDSDPKDVLRIALFNGPADIETEPVAGERSWHIHAGAPPESSHKKNLVWFLQDPSRKGSRFQFMKMEQGATYRVFIEVDPKTRTFRCTISDGVNLIYNNNRRGLPKFNPDSFPDMEAIHLFVWGKPGKECRFSIDEFLIRNAPKPRAIRKK